MQRRFPTGCYACEARVERAAMGTKLRSRGLAPRGTEFLLLDDFELARELPPLLGELEIGRTKLRRDGLLSHGLALGGLCEALLCVAVHDEPTRKTAWPFRNGARQLARMPGHRAAPARPPNRRIAGPHAMGAAISRANTLIAAEKPDFDLPPMADEHLAVRCDEDTIDIGTKQEHSSCYVPPSSPEEGRDPCCRRGGRCVGVSGFVSRHDRRMGAGHRRLVTQRRGVGR